MSCSRTELAILLVCVLAACSTHPPVEQLVGRYEQCPEGKGQELLAKVRAMIAASSGLEAVPILEEALRTCPDNVQLHVTYQDTALAAGLGERVATFYATFRGSDRSPVPTFARARLEQDPAKALLMLESCLELDRSFYFAYLSKGRLLRGQRRNEDAILSLERAIDINPSLSEADLELAELKEEAGERRLAAIHYRRYLASNPQNRIVRENFVRLLIESGHDLDEAVPVLERLIAEDPDAKNLLLLKGALLWKRGDLSGARDVYRSLLREEPTEARAMLNLGNLYLEGLKDPARARLCYLHYLQLPRMQGVHDTVDKLFSVPQRLRQIEKTIGPFEGALPPVGEL